MNHPSVISANIVLILTGIEKFPEAIDDGSFIAYANAVCYFGIAVWLFFANNKETR